MRSRDDRIVSLASNLNLDGYEQGPFGMSVVKRFLAQVAQLRQELEEKAAREKVREVEFIAIVDHCYGFIDDCTVKFGREGVNSLDLSSCRLLLFSNWFLTCMDSLQVFSRV